MTIDPDAKPRRMGAHVYTVEDLDMSEHGMPGFTFNGDVHIEPDDTPGVDDWLIVKVCAPDGREASPYQTDRVIKAVMADADLCDLITEACYEHGEAQ